ncbi:MAG TPA: copper resistance CopC family protein, partial [Solirubrobacteraceae bacterium]|nr:copper resistance CopC family protein [Solirubrobacteraceae bacterium]
MSTRTAARRRRASARRLPVALAAAVALAWALPGQAAAHAVLQHTTPHQNSAVDAAPSSVRLDFNEPVEVSFGAVRVYDEHGGRVDSGKVDYPGGTQSSVTVGVRDGLDRGVYTTTYRVVSADGHPVSGGFAFGVGEPVTAQRGTPAVADLLARSAASPAVEGAYGLARGLHYAA